MRSLIFTLATLALLSSAIEAKRKNWVLLIAGSKYWENYRHQADVCHAYQIFHKAGIPDEQIVVMMFDDIANNYYNPFKGNIINRPGGPNVYPGVPKDYTGDEVNAKMFLAVLQGDKETVKNLTGQNKKVIDSGPDDHIFVNFADHGAAGLLAMPKPPYLKATDVNKALKSMHAKKRFAKLIFYVEACESGSIFDKILPKDINVYVTTAANPYQSSYACYYDKTRQNYLGDCYSVNWMEDTDKADLQKETFEQQYITVKQKTNTSEVMQYGDTSIDKSTLDKFFSNAGYNSDPEDFPSSSKKDAIPSEMVRVQTLKNRIQTAPFNSVERTNLEKKLESVYEEMKQTHDLFNNIARTLYTNLSDNKVYDLAFRKRSDIKNWDCYEAAVDTLTGFCPGIDGNNDFAFRKFYVLVNLCNDQDQGKVISAIETSIAVSPFCFKDIF